MESMKQGWTDFAERTKRSNDYQSRRIWYAGVLWAVRQLELARHGSVPDREIDEWLTVVGFDLIAFGQAVERGEA